MGNWTVAEMNASSWYNKGNELIEIGLYEEALEAFEHALWLDKNYTEALNGKGNALLNLGRFDEALEAYERALELAQSTARA